tara:strand:- start:3719 stop:4282 length:564 start_codon:yes stop_codon:yes gene_type:complete
VNNIDINNPKGHFTCKLIVTLAILVIVMIVALPIETYAQKRGELGIALGEQPELVEIEDLDGNPLKLADYIGKKPLLIEFYAIWCDNCTTLLPQMTDVYDRYQEQIEFLAISVAVSQSPKSIKKTLEKHPVDFATVWDEGGRAVRAFLVPATSYIVVLDKQGIVTYTGIGPKQNIEEAVLTALGKTD